MVRNVGGEPTCTGGGKACCGSVTNPMQRRDGGAMDERIMARWQTAPTRAIQWSSPACASPS